MNLVFQECIDFLKAKGITYDLEEGYYWLDRKIIKAFDSEGNVHKIIRVYVDEELNFRFKSYKNKPFKMESWEDTIKRNEERLLQLERSSIKDIERVVEKFPERNYAVLTSGGKDSCVTSHLVSQVVKGVTNIFNNTSLDCADSYLFIKSFPNLSIINPKEGFYTWRERNNFVGNRTARACCRLFKEVALTEHLDKKDDYLFFMGMRNEESVSRSQYKSEWKNEEWGIRKWDASLPVVKWTEVDVWLYILWRGVDIHPKYKKGYNRVGCAIACPYYGDFVWALDSYWYPYQFERWHKILEDDFIKNKKAPILNCTLKEYHYHWCDTSYREEATEEVILEFAETQGLELEIAKKYFDKKCVCCNKKLKKDDVALSLKNYGRFIEKFKCKECIGKENNLNKAQVGKLVKELKNTGCVLF